VFQFYQQRTQSGATNAPSSHNFFQPGNLQTNQVIERTADEDPEFASHINVMKRMSQLRFKDVLKETLAELERKGRNFVCIYPAPGCEVYDKYFTQVRPLNKFLSRILFHDELNFAAA